MFMVRFMGVRVEIYYAKEFDFNISCFFTFLIAYQSWSMIYEEREDVRVKDVSSGFLSLAELSEWIWRKHKSWKLYSKIS